MGNPDRSGWLPRDAPDVGTGESGSLASGMLTRIQLRIDGANGRIDDAVFKVVGDHAAVASASFVTGRLHGARLSEVRELDGVMVVAELQLPIEQAYVAGMAVEAARAAVADWERKQRRPRQ